MTGATSKKPTAAAGPKAVMLAARLVLVGTIAAACRNDDREPARALPPSIWDSVLTLHVVAQVHDCPWHPTRRSDLFGPLPGHGCKVRRLGSGFVVDGGGIALTNDHVVDRAVLVEAVLADGARRPVRILGSDADTDVAVIAIEGDSANLPALPIGRSADVEVGDRVFALGSPLGLEGTMTQGIVSHRDRKVPGRPLVPFIQTDAGVHPGHSGGPLVDAAGRAVGLNAAYVHSEGLSLAIPIDLALRVAQDLRAGRGVERGSLGLAFQPLDPDLARGLGLVVDRGLLVTDVAPGGAAEEAGIAVQDVIVALDGRDAAEIDEADVAALAPGRTVAATVVTRTGQVYKEIRVGRRASPSRATRALATTPLGMSLGEAPIGVYGAMVLEVEPGGAAERSGLETGDLIVEAGGRPIATLAAFRSVAEPVAGSGGDLLLRVRRGSRHRFALLAVPVPP